MSSVTSTTANGYYQLSALNTGTGATTASASDLALSALGGASGSGSSSGTSSLAYILNLSSEAQAYLNGSGGTDGSLSIPGASAATGNDSYTLTDAQQKTLTYILAKYKDEPFDQDTFDQIQDDLNAAGLSTPMLAAQDQAKRFNPTQYLLNALTGSSAIPATTPSSTDPATQSANFMSDVLAQWKNISTTADATGSTDATTTGTNAAS